MFSLLAVLAVAGNDSAMQRLRMLSARADSLAAVVAARQVVERRAVAALRQPQEVRSGDLDGVFWSAVPRRAAEGIVARADSALRAFGGIPTAFLARIVAVQMWTAGADSIGAAAARTGRIVVNLDWTGRADDTLATSDNFVLGVARAYLATLDTSWQEYLSGQYGALWRPQFDGAWTLHAFAGTEHSAGRTCLGGQIAACRQWLGVDPSDHPYRERYAPADIRALDLNKNYLSDTDWRACAEGDDRACIDFVEARRVVNPIPAGSEMRASLLRALLALHGPGALDRALRDSTGSIGARLSRASGLSEDAFLAEWRVWVLSRGRPQRVTAGAGDAVPVVLAIGVLLAIATRRGRWT